MYVCVYMAITVVGWLVVCLVWLDGEDRALTVHTDMLCVARADNCGWLVWLDGEDRALTVHTDMLCVARADNCCWLVWLDGEDCALTVHTDMLCVARAMSHPDSGLEIRDRLWLKITIPRAFIG